jgi:hypothetical protein
VHTHTQFARISRPKLQGLGRHEAVLLPNGLVAHTTQGKWPHLTTYEDFRQGKDVLVEDLLVPAEHSAAAVRLRDLLEKREPYDPLFSNCETFARTVIRGERISWQAVVLLGLTGVGIYWFAKNSKPGG